MLLLRKIRKEIKKLLLIVAAISTALTVGNGFTEQETTSETAGLILSTTQSETAAAEAASTAKAQSQETHILLADELTFIKGEGASFSDGIVTVEKSGTYLFKGELNEGRIVVDLIKDDADEVVLVFYGVKIGSSKGAPVSVLSAPSGAKLRFAERTSNIFYDTDERVRYYREEDGDSAVIFSAEPLTLEGEGRIHLRAEFNKGIFTKESLSLDGAVLSVESFDDGIRSDGDIRIRNSDLMINSGGDGLHCGNLKQNKQGDVYILDSKLSLFSSSDGIDSCRDITVSGGTVEFITGGGSVGRAYGENHGFGISDKLKDKNMNGLFTPGRATQDSTTLENILEKKDSVSAVFAQGNAEFKDVAVSISSAQHGFSCENAAIEKGKYSVRCDGNGFYVSERISVESSNLNIIAYGNGAEGESIRFEDGEIFISSSGEALISSKGKEHIDIISSEVQIKTISQEKSNLF